MTMALLEFEMVAPTSPQLWFIHAEGALRLLELVGRQGCQKVLFLRFLAFTLHNGKLSARNDPVCNN